MLTDNTIQLIRNSPDLYAAVCKMLDRSPTYLHTLLRKKDKQLTQMNVLQLISNHTGIAVNALLEENAEVKAA